MWHIHIYPQANILCEQRNACYMEYYVNIICLCNVHVASVSYIIPNEEWETYCTNTNAMLH